MALNFNQPLTDEQKRFSADFLRNNGKPYSMLTPGATSAAASKLAATQRAMATARPTASVDTGSTVAAAPPTDVNANYIAAAPAKKLDEAQLRSLDSLLSSLDTVRNQSKEKARLKRDEARTTKDREKESEETKYKGKKVNVLQDFAGAKTDTDLNTRNTLENLMSTLSTMGLSGSRALTRQILSAANKSNRKANATQARDQQGLDTAWNEYESGYNDDVKKIDDQMNYEQSEADRAWGQNRQNYLHKKADVYNQADRTNERTALMSEADSLNGFIGAAPFMNPQYTGKSRAMAAPELSDYQQDIGTYDTTAVGANAAGLAPVGAGVTPGAGNLAIKAMAINDRDLGVKKKTEGVDPILGV